MVTMMISVTSLQPARHVYKDHVLLPGLERQPHQLFLRVSKSYISLFSLVVVVSFVVISSSVVLASLHSRSRSSSRSYWCPLFPKRVERANPNFGLHRTRTGVSSRHIGELLL